MKPLLEIQTVPIAIEYKTTRAQVSRVAKPNADARQRQPARRQAPQRSGQSGPKLDTVDVNRRGIARVSPRQRSTTAQVSFYDAGGKVQSASYEATARMGKEGQVMVDLRLSKAASATAAAEVGMAAGQTAADMYEVPESLSLTYQVDKLQYELRQDNEGFEFTPGNVEFSVTEYAKVLIEYVGSPLYVPPSADPNYEPIDVLV